MYRNRPWTFAVAASLFFCSGALGLGYELIWIRKAALVVGASQIALSTVLTSFFLGLALGSYFVGRYLRSRRLSSLFLYGAFETTIGLFALAFPALFRLLERVYGAAYPIFDGSSAALFALRFLLLFLLFVAPTFFMGGTLPLLLDGLVAQDRFIGTRTSLLYGINILGAVAGVLVTSYFAIPSLGMDGTSLAGGAANLAVGGIALLLFRGDSPPARDEGSEPLPRFFVLAAFASGLLALAYQICWARYFSLVHFSTVYLTAVLLAVYLLSLAVGSLLLAPLLRREWSPLRILGVAQALVPVGAILGLGAWRAAEYRFARSSITLEVAHDYPRFWHLWNETADATFFAPLFQVALTIFVPVVLLGTGLPALIAGAAHRSSAVKSVSGRLVFWNMLGSSAGSFLAGYALLPLLGLHFTLLVLGLGSLGLALAAAMRAAPARRWVPLSLPVLSLLALVLLAALRADVTRETIRLQQFGRDASAVRLTSVVEGPLATAYVFEDPGAIRLGSGAVQMGNIQKGGVGLQVIEGHLPVVFYPGPGAPERCLGICLGSGQSFGALLRYPIRSLDVVEISGEITRLASGPLGPYNNHLARDGRVRFHLDDGRHFVERAPAAAYDLVSMESSPPITDGMYALYSVEFYEQVRRILKPDGVFMQFLPLYYLTPLDVKCVLRTLSQVFPNTFVVKVSPGDCMLLAYPSRPRFLASAIRDRAHGLAGEWTSRSLPPGKWTPDSTHPIASFEGIVSQILMGPEGIQSLQAPVLLRDDRQLLSYGTGDRWLSRRYLGPTLAPLSFTALSLADFERLKDYFEPPLSDQAVETLTAERVRALKTYNVPDPRDLAQRTRALDSAQDPVERAGQALQLAQLHDAVLQKDEAYRFVGIALEALEGSPQRTSAGFLETVRGIVRNRIAVYGDVAVRWVGSFQQKYAGAPLLEAMQAELQEYRAREAKAASRYLWPR